MNVPKQQSFNMMCGFSVGMSKRISLSLLAVFIMLFSSGCARFILVEKATPQRSPDVLYFAGTQAGVAASLGIFGSGGIAFLPIIVPCEVAADILFLPYDAARHLQYVCHPPLNEIIWKNDLGKLSKRLACGDDPNAIDFRFFGRKGQYPHPPLLEAFMQRRLEAFNMLLDYGAEVPLELFNNENLQQIRMVSSDTGLAFLKVALQKGIASEKLNSFDAATVVPNLLPSWRKYRHVYNEDSYHILYSLLSLLLESGFPPNGLSDSRGEQTTALDHLLEIPPSENRDRLVTLIRSHGAMTFAELDAMKPHETLPQEINPLDVHECFKPVMDILLQDGKNRKHNGHYRFSASYPGIEEPLVVVDVPWKNGTQTSCRKFVNVHRRKTATQWDIHGEPFDIPAYLRIVLTPPGVRVPSRLGMDLPKKDVLLEEWHTLPTCELYIERPPRVVFGRMNLGIEKDIAQILALIGLRHDIYGKDDSYYFKHDPINRIGRLYYHNIINRPYSLELKDLKEEYLWAKNANAMAKKAGLNGVWRVRTCGSRACFYTSHRDLPFLDKTLDHRVPYPDEIFAVVHTRLNTIPTADSATNDGKGNNQDYYWNCRVYDFPQKGDIVLYYGDEASQETLNAVVKMSRELMKW